MCVTAFQFLSHACQIDKTTTLVSSRSKIMSAAVSTAWAAQNARAKMLALGPWLRCSAKDPFASLLVSNPKIRIHGPGGRGTSASTRVSEISRGPIGLMTVRVGAIAIRAGAMFRPCNTQVIQNSRLYIFYI